MHDLMQVGKTISALGLIDNEETDEVAIELTVPAKLTARFPDLSLVELNKAIAIAFDGRRPSEEVRCIKPKRIQLRRTSGWRLLANTAKVDTRKAQGFPMPICTHSTSPAMRFSGMELYVQARSQWITMRLFLP